MNDQNTANTAIDVFIAKALQRNEGIAMNARGEEYEEACDELLKPLVYHTDDGNTFYGLQLPRCFPSMTELDMLTVLEWYSSEGTVVRSGSDLVEVHANFGDIVIPMHPAMRGSYRVVQILKPQNDSIQMGDLLIILQMITHQTLTRKKQKRAAA